MRTHTGDPCRLSGDKCYVETCQAQTAITPPSEGKALGLLSIFLQAATTKTQDLTAKAGLNVIVFRVSQVYGTGRWGKENGNPG